MATLAALTTLTATAAFGQPEGIWQGYDGEWLHVTQQLVALAEATPADKFAWLPAPGVRTVSEVYMHIALSNFMLLGATGIKLPADVTPAVTEKSVKDKAEVIRWLKRSMDAVKNARAALKPGQLQLHVEISGRAATVDGIYLRIVIHANEHMGQLIAYARMSGVAPPWSTQ